MALSLKKLSEHQRNDIVSFVASRDGKYIGPARGFAFPFSVLGSLLGTWRFPGILGYFLHDLSGTLIDKICSLFI